MRNERNELYLHRLRGSYADQKDQANQTSASYSDAYDHSPEANQDQLSVESLNRDDISIDESIVRGEQRSDSSSSELNRGHMTNQTNDPISRKELSRVQLNQKAGQKLPNIAEESDDSQLSTTITPNNANNEIDDIDLTLTNFDGVILHDDEEITIADASVHTEHGGNDVGASQSTINRQKKKTKNPKNSGHSKKKPKLIDALEAKKRWKCEFCEYSTIKKSILTRHIRTHNNERPFKCEVCEKKFTRQDIRNRHMKIHKNMFGFQCIKCHRGFADENTWKLHEIRCKVKNYECYLCKKISWDKQDSVDHMRYHTGERLHCSKCRKQFITQTGLKLHMISHVPISVFKMPPRILNKKGMKTA